MRLADSTGYLVNRVAALLKVALERELRAHDVTAQQWAVLATLAERGPSRLGALAEVVGIDAGATSRLIDRLEAKKLCRRATAGDDARALEITLTPKGAALHPALADAAARVLDQQLAGLTRTERRQLDALLGKVLGP